MIMSSEFVLRLLRRIVVFTAGSILIWFIGLVLFFIGVNTVQPHQTDKKTDAIVVLTGGQNRVNTGLDLLNDEKANYLFISGVNPDVTIMELVKLWKPDTDFIPCCIILGHNANNTEENARESSLWVRQQGANSIRLVTSNYHLPRAWIEFSHALPRRKLIAHPIRPVSLDNDSRYIIRLVISEYNKTLLTWVRLYVYPWDTIGNRS